MWEISPINYKLAELETAADLASNGKIPEAEKIYGRINSQIDTIYKHISAMSGPEILKAITEMGADGFMLGTVFKAGTHLLRNARLSNISTDECIANLCKEVGCEVPKNAKDALAIFDKTKSTTPYTHTFKYHPRIRARALQDPVAHNFPYSFDDIILKTKPIVQQDGSFLYRAPGTLNGKRGFFELAINQTTKTIFHRTFVRKK